MLNARVKKPDTGQAFNPPLPHSGPTYARAKASFRRDGRLDQNPINARLRQMWFERTRLTNLVSSYAIEGIRVSRIDAARAINNEEERGSHSIRAFANTYRVLHENPLPKLTSNWIRHLHGDLFHPESLDAGIPGEFKTEENGVFDEDKNEFVFQATPPGDATVAELNSLISWFYDVAHRYPPPIGAAVFFAEFEAIHPFADGNGRLGRLLNLYALKQLGQENAFLLPLDREFLRRHKAYYAALETTNAGTDYSRWLEFYQTCLEAAQDEAESLTGIVEGVEELLRPSEREVLNWLLATAPTTWFQRRDYPNPSDFSGAALTSAFARLVELEILEFQGENRGRRYKLKGDAVTTLGAKLRHEAAAGE